MIGSRLGRTGVVDRLVGWADAEERIRALVLEGSSGSVRGRTDQLSDYDVLVVVADAATFVADDEWQRAMGVPMVRFADQAVEEGMQTYMRLVLYADGTKVDYCIWPAKLLEKVVTAQALPALLDTGYAVLVDKDLLAARLPVATDQRTFRADRLQQSTMRS